MDEILTQADRLAELIDQAPREGVGLCLSGGGYRAMLFHVGALWRLNELGWLARLSFVSSVSGGSITAGVLAAKWQALAFGDNGVAANFTDQIADPLRALANRTVDVPSILTGIATPRRTVGDRTTAALRRHLFGAATLADLPDSPRFISPRRTCTAAACGGSASRTCVTGRSAGSQSPGCPWRRRSRRPPPSRRCCLR